jgi:hypothetical protein
LASNAVAGLGAAGLPSENENGNEPLALPAPGAAAAGAGAGAVDAGGAADEGWVTPDFARGAGVGSGTSSAAADAARSATPAIARRNVRAPRAAIPSLP